MHASRRRFARTLPAIAAALTIPVGAAAQAYPSRQVNLVVPYPPGGPSDFLARQIQPGLARLLGQPVIVDNVAGASGSIGVQKVLTAPSDGHTLLLGSPMELVLAPLAMSAVRYRPEDLRLAARLVSTSMVLLVRRDLPAGSVDELVALASRPGAKELTYGTVGPGSLYHLVSEDFARMTSTKLVHVPYKGAAPLLADLMGGQIDMVFMPFAGNVPSLIAEGRVKALGLTTRTPHPRFPQLPALAQSKGLERLEFDLWAGIQLPRGASAEVVNAVNRAVRDALQDPELRKAYENTGNAVAEPMGPEPLARLYAAEIERYQGIARSIGLQPQ
jgi:tripartite-type tricarboxylate transporter receptor subunit TctC